MKLTKNYIIRSLMGKYASTVNKINDKMDNHGYLAPTAQTLPIEVCL